jgi:hypothetical protein
MERTAPIHTLKPLPEPQRRERPRHTQSGSCVVISVTTAWVAGYLTTIRMVAVGSLGLFVEYLLVGWLGLRQKEAEGRYDVG